MAARGQREPAGLDADDGEWAAFQRHRVPARWHREPRPHPRHHRHQPELRRDSGNEDHLAELRRGVRAGDRRCRIGADQVGFQCAARHRIRVPPRRSAGGAQSVLAGGGRSAHGQVHPRHEAQSVRRIARWTNSKRQDLLLRRLSRPAEQHRRLTAVNGADGRRAQRRFQRVRREHLRSAQRGDAGSARAVPEQRHSLAAAFAAGAGHPQADSAPESSRHRQRHAQ